MFSFVDRKYAGKHKSRIWFLPTAICMNLVSDGVHRQKYVIRRNFSNFDFSPRLKIYLHT